MNYSKQFYDLYQFLGAYFNQDWTDEYDWKEQKPDFEPVVHFYKAKNPSTTVARATEQLEKFLALPLDDEQLEEIVTSEFGSSYYPAPRGLTERQWLEQVLKLLKQPVDANAPVLSMT